MADAPRISSEEFIRRIEKIYNWDVTDTEKDTLLDMARLYRGSVVLDHWELFQKKYPGHPAWEFAEWFDEIKETEDEN